MPCHPMINTTTKEVEGIVCTGGPVYDFEGFLFEVHGYCGPHPLRRTDGSPRENIPKRFWAMWDRFEKLSAAERKSAKVDLYTAVIGKRKRG